MTALAWDAVKLVNIEYPDGSKEIDIKRYAKIEKVNINILFIYLL